VNHGDRPLHRSSGLNLFVAAGVTRQFAVGRHKAALPWLAILVVFLLLITYVPIVPPGLPLDLALGKTPVRNDQ